MPSLKKRERKVSRKPSFKSKARNVRKSKTVALPRRKLVAPPDEKIVKRSRSESEGPTEAEVAAAIAVLESIVDDVVVETPPAEVSEEDDNEESTDGNGEEAEEEATPAPSRPVRTTFDPGDVEEPLEGTPAEVQVDLDNIAIRLQRRPRDKELFNKVVLYMHKYILGLVFKKYSFVMGYDESDMYQEALIALSKKAIPGFRKGKGMSFLNFAKMCINRHLITILHASKHRCKDKPLNLSISLDHNPAGYSDDDDSCPLSNVITDLQHQQPPYDGIVRDETFRHTLGLIRGRLSRFERTVLDEYLEDNSYRDSAKNISKRGERCNEKSIDNALLRIRKKASDLKDEEGRSSIPLLD